MKNKKRYLVIIVALLMLFVSGCDFSMSNNPPAPQKEMSSIVLNPNGASLAVKNYEVEIGQTFDLPELSLEGYYFLGWLDEDDEGEPFMSFQVEKASYHLIAQFEDDVEYSKAKEINLNIFAIREEQIRSTWLPRLTTLKEAYLALDPAHQALVTYYDRLEQYIERATLLINAEAVMEAIDALPSKVGLADEEEVNRCNGLYLALTPAEQALVTNYDKVTRALARIEAIKSESNQYPDLINEAILKLPYQLTYDYYEDATYILDLYNDLDAEGRLLVDYPELITKLQTEVAAFDESNDLILCLGKDIYASRDEFGNAWFRDFYQYLLYHGGASKLASEGINSVDQFVALAHDYNAGNGQMRYLGNTFSQWYLAKDVNGILSNQPETAFLGFCYQNGLYEDYLPFLLRFFAYWRLDEKYANTSNYGADSFADRWATLVDTCKFFYYDVNTSYVKTARMQDCFNFCSNVCYGELPVATIGTITLPTDLTRRGYTFLGWYDNANFTGSPITSISYNGEKIVLYAKWGVDQNQVDIDSAALVDVYIYNLTTDPAAVNDRTVGYVMDMYNALTAEGKALVTRYDTLLSMYRTINSEELSETKVISVTYVGVEAKSFDTLKSEFLSDYNALNGTSITDYNTFIQNRYGEMARIRAFYNDMACYSKWSWLFNYFTTISVARGVKVQAGRALTQTNGDAEYLSKAIAYFFMQTDATSDSEVAFDFSTPNVSTQMQVTYTFTNVVDLPQLILTGYTFNGFYSDSSLTNKITTVTDATPNTLYASFTKNS
ncbi:MAG: InlB B-repeat-containing protein [Bacilli bacterium]|nr:InlB B-repeat-containing protein [Bacilli bacterium]